jgi:hypothetical protein
LEVPYSGTPSTLRTYESAVNGLGCPSDPGRKALSGQSLGIRAASAAWGAKNTLCLAMAGDEIAYRMQTYSKCQIRCACTLIAIYELYLGRLRTVPLGEGEQLTEPDGMLG